MLFEYYTSKANSLSFAYMTNFGSNTLTTRALRWPIRRFVNGTRLLRVSMDLQWLRKCNAKDTPLIRKRDARDTSAHQKNATRKTRPIAASVR